MKKIIMALLCCWLVMVSGCAMGIEESLLPAYSVALEDTSKTPDVQLTLLEETLPNEDAIRLLRAKELLSAMTMEQKMGQLFLVRAPQNAALAWIETYQPGGFILFARDFEDKNPQVLASSTAAYQQASQIPMLIAVDEEGGTVVRISKYSAFRDTSFASPRALYAEGGWQLLKRDTQEKCHLLTSLGINVNLAPVCDLAETPGDYMYQRSFSGDPYTTATYVEQTVRIMNEEGIGSSLKHFPGYGNNADTHEAVVYDQRDYDIFAEHDFLPFAAGIAAGAGSVLVSHNVVICMDAKTPASLSPAVHQILRKQLNFEGVILTDDLEMVAAVNYGAEQSESLAVLALQAGNDMLVVTDLPEQFAAIEAAVNNGRVSEQAINQAVLRILCWKLQLGLCE